MRRNFLMLMISLFLLVACGKVKTVSGDLENEQAEITEEKYYRAHEDTYQLGECVVYLSPTIQDEKNIGFNFVITQATVYNTPTEAGISQEQLSQVELYDLEELPIMLSVQEICSKPFLLTEVEITNINEQDTPNITLLSLVAERADGSMIRVSEPAYFPQTSSAGPGTPDFWHFSLLKGQSTTLQVGWPIDYSFVEKEKLYLSGNFGGAKGESSYIYLDLGEDDK